MRSGFLCCVCGLNSWLYLWLLGMFAKLQKGFVFSAHIRAGISRDACSKSPEYREDVNVCPHGTTQFPLERLSWNLIF